MTPERWALVRTIFEQALDLEPGARAAFVKSASANDPEVEEGVGRLLAADEEAGDFLEGGALGDAGTGEDVDEESLDRRRVGPYEILEAIGHGGMGTVYRARRSDGEFRSEVALKVVRRGMDSAFILHRFRMERQILAGLNHPNIARLLDGGTTDDGMPYFVMELVQGQDLLGFCESRTLPVPDRLRLFRVVCEAVHFAHRSLVVHRDLKPANILVTADGAPKLLDFGLAKLLAASETGETMALTVQQGLRLLTPEYASPEQIRGEAITTSSDIYSLGVVLYELLSGTKPHIARPGEAEELARAVCNEDPRPPTEVAPDRRLDPDLDTIVLMALRKEPERRYASAEQLSEDVRRFLEGRPVSARKDTLGYRTAKFVRRHRVSVAAGTLVAASLVGGLGAALWEMRVAQRERARAEEHFAEVRKLATSFLFEHHDAIKDLAGSTPARKLLVERGVAYLDRLAQEGGDDPTLKRELAEAYERLGNLQGGVGNQGSLGDSAGARQSYSKSFALREWLTHRTDPDPNDRNALAGTHLALGQLLRSTGDKRDALAHFREAVVIREALASANPASAAPKRDLGAAYHRLGGGLFDAGDEAGHIEAYRKEIRLFAEVTTLNPGDKRDRRNLALGHLYLGSALAQKGDFTAAIESLERARQLQEGLVAEDASNATFKKDLSNTTCELGNSLHLLGHTAQAEESYRSCLRIREALIKADATDIVVRRLLASAELRLGSVLRDEGALAEALEHGRKAASLTSGVAEADPKNAFFQGEHARSLYELGRTLDASSAAARGPERRRLLEEALGCLERGHEIFSGLVLSGTLPATQAEYVEPLAAKLKECQAELARKKG